MIRKKILKLLMLNIMILGLFSCNQKEDEFQNYLKEGKTYFQKNELKKAKIQLLNALKINSENSEVYLYLGETYLKERDIRAAVSNYMQAIRINKENKIANQRMGQLLFSAKRYRDALLFLKQAQKSDPNDLNIGFLYSLCLFKNEKIDEAEAMVLSLLKKYPNDPKLLILKGSIHLTKYNDFKKAEDSFKKAIQSNKDKFDNFLPLLNLYMNKGLYNTVEKLLLDSEKKYPVDSKINILLSQYYLSRNKINSAEIQLKKAINKNPQEESYYKELAYVYINYYKDMPKAEETLKRAISKNRENLNGYMNLALYYLSLKEDSNAENILKKAQEKFPNRPEPMRLLAQYYYEIKAFGKAKDTYKKLQSLNKNDKIAELIEAKIYLIKGNLKKSRDILNKLIKEDPNYYEAIYTKALAYLTEGKNKMAKESILKTLEINPAHLKANLLMSELLIQEQDYEEAITYLKKAKKINPVDVRIYINLGRISLLTKDFNGAETNFLKVKELNANGYLGNLYLGNTYLREQKFDEALQEYKTSLEKNPNDLDAISNIPLIYLIKKEKHKAVKFCHDRLLNTTDKRTRALILYTLGKVYMASKETTSAKNSFLSSIEENPQIIMPYVQLAKLALMENNISSAIQYYKELEKHDEQNLGILMTIGVLYDQKNDKKNAKIYYTRCLDIKKDFAPAANNLAWLITEQGGNLDEALSFAQIAKGQMPDNPYVSDTLGWIYVKKNAVLSGISQLEDAHKILNKTASVTYHLAYAYFKNNELEKAKKTVNTACRKFYSN